MAQIQKGTTYATGTQVTADNLNAHVDSAILLPGAIGDQINVTSLAQEDSTIILQSGSLKEATIAQIKTATAPDLTGYLKADGSVSITTGQQLTLGTTNQLTALNATSKGYVDSLVPAGTIIQYAGATAPNGFLICPITPTNISRTSYPGLFAAIGTTWGVGDGSTTFGMPWFIDGGVAVQSNGNVGQQTVGQVISHSHNFTSYIATGGGLLASSAVSSNSFSNTTDNTGGTNNLAAGSRILYCVKY
jgi:hypothetical protein